ncbi:MAG: MBL fold metallo-hydrolase [Acidobacteria bacterium]|nr:MBL fold metallo-hydrolase [Acidobacteriota bacterium]
MQPFARIMLVALALVSLVVATGDAQNPLAAGQVPGTTAQQAIDAAAAALGGAGRLRALRNITLTGYAQYAYQNGGGNISPLPGAPQKFIAANDYRRIYDVQNMRMLHQERRNDLFPFANYGGHSFALQRQGLDGDVAYNVNAQGAAARGGDARDRRMWMHANPVTAVRAALTGAATVSNRRQQDGLTLVDLTLREGDRMTLAIRPPENRPHWISWIGPNTNLGEVVYTTTFYGYQPYGGVELPMGYTTKIDWRDVDFMKLYVDGYYVDGDIPNLAASATFPPAPLGGTLAGPPQLGAGTLTQQPNIASLLPAPRTVGPGGAAAGAGRGGGGGRAGGTAGGGQQQIPVVNVARGVWRFGGGTIALEFADHITLFEAGGGLDRVRQVVAQARQLVPGKPVTQLIQSHHHFDHTAGLRQAVAEGLTIISRRDNGVIFKEMTDRKAPNFPDDLHRSGRTLSFIPVDDHLQLRDATMTVDIFRIIANNHIGDGVFAYIPEHKIYIEADIATAAEEVQWWGDSFLDNITHRKIDVDTVVPVHMDIMTFEETVRMVRPGIERVKQYCQEMVAKGNWFPGCPAFLR